MYVCCGFGKDFKKVWPCGKNCGLIQLSLFQVQELSDSQSPNLPTDSEYKYCTTVSLALCGYQYQYHHQYYHKQTHAHTHIHTQRWFYPTTTTQQEPFLEHIWDLSQLMKMMITTSTKRNQGVRVTIITILTGEKDEE
mmetsp:Transcript_37685/g.53144  ORF Transcript_37685/g.53144 Transcript_37685/m.53144 type:complete len:138 (+) Transcript_37685:2-415(+)